MDMSSLERVRTGIPGFDTMLNGGYLPNSSNLVEGPPGCGKSTLGMQFIHKGTQLGEPGIILTFEQLPESYYRDAANFGWSFHALERTDMLRVVVSSPEVAKIDLEQTGGMLEQLIMDIGAKRIVIDSITHFENALPPSASGSRWERSGGNRLSEAPVKAEGVHIQRDHLYSFLNALKRQGLTSLVTRESLCLFGDAQEDSSDTGIHFVVDSYTMLRYVEIESAVKRAVIVLKMRGSAHDHAIRQFEIGAQGLSVTSPFEGQEGLMSGIPQQHMADSFIKAFVRK